MNVRCQPVTLSVRPSSATGSTSGLLHQISLIYPAQFYKSSVLSGGPDSERREAIVKSERPGFGRSKISMYALFDAINVPYTCKGRQRSRVFLQCFQELSFAVMILSRCEGDLPAPTGTGFGYGEKSSVCP